MSDEPAPENVRTAAGDLWDITPFKPDEPLNSQFNRSGLAMIYPNGSSDDPRYLSSVIKQLDRSSAVGIFLLPGSSQLGWNLLSQRNGQFLYLRHDASVEQISAHLAAASSLQPTIGNLRAELHATEAMKAKPDGIPDNLDEEMRLAARLQRDFLPRRLHEIGPVRFGILYRPASWVSGDIYDIVRLDETHVGFYIADAVGHGLPAALLTMFIKKALQTKRVLGNEYKIISPEVSLSGLNSDICEQNLSSCQFCTAVYCILDTATLQLTYARAGHPEVIHIKDGGEVDTLPAQGTLLGVFPEASFECRQIQLTPGDRLLLYTDGAEQILMEKAPQPEEQPENIIANWVNMPRDEMLLKLTNEVESNANSNHLDDDVTVMVVDIEK